MLFVAAVCLLFLSGCRPGGLGSGFFQKIEKQENGKNQEMIYLSVLAGQSTTDAGIEDMIDEMVAAILPNVRLEWECVDWGENFHAELNARFAAGDVPDIIIGKAQDASNYYATGNLAPIDGTFLECMEETAKKAVTVEGKAYGIPYNSWYQGVIYNKRMFEECGLSVPKDFRQMQETVKTLEEHKITPFASHFQESWAVGNMTMQFMLNDIFQENPLWGQEFRQGRERYVGNEAMISCIENSRYILEHSWEDALSIDQAVCDNRFDKGEAAMYLTGTWSLQFANQNHREDTYGIFPYPGREGEASLIQETNMTFMKSACTEYSQEIDEIFRHLLSDQELMGEILNYTQTFSVKKGFQAEFRGCLMDDIAAYRKEGRIVDATIGNTQLIWFFQNDIAAQELLWLQGNQTLAEVLDYADRHRQESIMQ